MFTLSKGTITLDVSSTGIRLLATKGMQVNRWASAPLEPGLFENGLVTDPPALGARIKELMKASKIKGRKVIASVSGVHSVCRLLNLPYTAEQSIEEAIFEVVRESMPVSVEELYLSRQTVANDETGQLVLIIGMLRNQVDAQIQALRAAGIKPRILNLRSIALVRLIDQPEAYIANMEPDSLDIALVIDGIPQVIRTVAPAPNISLDMWMGQIVRALEQTVRFYASQHPHDPYPYDIPLFLTGPLADNAELVQMLQNSYLYSLLPLSVPLQYSENLPLNHYAVNIGLAIGQLSIPTRVEAVESTPERMEADE